MGAIIEARRHQTTSFFHSSRRHRRGLLSSAPSLEGISGPTPPKPRITFQKEIQKLESVRCELTAPIRMETATRKRPGDGDEEKRRTRVRAEEERDRPVTDDEVEEFFTILRRVREAAKCFPVRDGYGGVGVRRRVAAEGLSRWRPRFEREDFEDGSNLRDAGRRGAEEVASGVEAATEETVAENAIPGRLDLNADPAPEGLDLGSPAGDPTAHVAS